LKTEAQALDHLLIEHPYTPFVVPAMDILNFEPLHLVMSKQNEFQSSTSIFTQFLELFELLLDEPSSQELLFDELSSDELLFDELLLDELLFDELSFDELLFDELLFDELLLDELLFDELLFDEISFDEYILIVGQLLEFLVIKYKGLLFTSYFKSPVLAIKKCISFSQL
jgi:hypothetical protein